MGVHHWIDGIARDPALRSGRRTTMYVCQNTLVPAAAQNGTEHAPYSTITAAVARAMSDGGAQWHFEIGFGDYSAESPISVPANVDYVFEGVIRRGAMTMGAILWDVAGNLTSRLGIKNIRTGAITAVDGVTPATNAVITVEDSELGSFTSTNSFVTMALVGASFAAFDPAISPVVQTVVSGSITMPVGTVFANNVQFRSTATLVKTGKFYASGCALAQPIQCTNAVADIRTSFWSASPTPSVTFIGAAGQLLNDAISAGGFFLNSGTITNGTQVITTAVALKTTATPTVPTTGDNTEITVNLTVPYAMLDDVVVVTIDEASSAFFTHWGILGAYVPSTGTVALRLRTFAAGFTSAAFTFHVVIVRARII